MSKTDILIIGAGASGLMAALTLAKAGKSVTILEARNRCGGRIHTPNSLSSNGIIELGAEFVHGDLPVTLGLLNAAGIAYYPVGGEMWHYDDGRFDNERSYMEDWGELMYKLDELTEDINIEAFLQNEFPGEKYNDLKASVRRFVHGYDSADATRASAFALRREWQSEDDATQYRIEGGYGALIKHLEEEFKKAGGVICLNSVVNDIYRGQGSIKVTTCGGKIYNAGQIIIALPLGVLQAGSREEGAVAFHPKVPQYQKALSSIGFGAVIKIVLEFDTAFWEDKYTEALAGKSLKNMGFLLTGEEIPAWWTQFPRHNTVLTGWFGGPDALLKKDTPADELLKRSLLSLCNIFKIDAAVLRKKLLAFHIVNWTNELYTYGSYTYDTIEAPAARNILKTPVDNNIFFAGEYLYDGPVMGTVEAALSSGEEVAKKVLAAL